MESKCYHISNVCVKEYGGKKYFSSTELSKIVEVDDIGKVCDESVVVDDGSQFFVGEIVGIVSYTEFQGCLSCGAKVTEINVGVGQCGKCGLKQKLSRCKRNASTKVVI